jgi:nucleoside-diphosphate-sugar epimerase
VSLAGAKVGVTGATGMVGRYLMRALRERGAHPVAVARTPDKPPSLRALGFEVRRADVTDRGALERAFGGLDAVISNAGVIALGGQRPADVLASNAGGTRNAFEAMGRAGVRRAVLTSSCVAYAPRRDHRYDEACPLRAPDAFAHRLNCYAISKAAAELAAREVADRYHIGLSIARPHQIHGAWDENGFTLWFRRLMSPRWISLWTTHWYFPSVYAGDLAEAMCRMLERDAAVGEAFNVTGEPGRESYWDHLGAWREAGQRVPKVVVPVPWPSRREYAIEKARAVLGWAPRPLVEAFRDLAAFEAEVWREVGR